MAEPDAVCTYCSKRIEGEGFRLSDDRQAHLRCEAMQHRLRSVEAGVRAGEAVVRSGEIRGRSQGLLDRLARRLPCPICGETLASPDAVMFETNRLVHARCWPGDTAPTRICARCSTPLEKYEPAAFEGRTVYHLRCWAASKGANGPATSD